MRLKTLCIFIVLQLIIFDCILPAASKKEKFKKRKIPKPYKERLQNAKFDNPNFVRDRFKNGLLMKPQVPDFWKYRNFTRIPYHPSWYEYCAPYQCAQYYKTACGLNRKTMKFKWFQSVCHLALHNMCSYYRGHIKYDLIENKYCAYYVMFLRTGCVDCEDDSFTPVCGMSYTDGHLVMFKNRCAMQKANCNAETLDDYSEVEIDMCTPKITFQSSCDFDCDDEPMSPVCALSVVNRHVKMFPNKCAMHKVNCYPDTLDSYSEVEMDVCIPKITLRSRCDCDDKSSSHVCAMSIVDSHVEMFPNKCAMQKVNCNPETFDNYVVVDMGLCNLIQIQENKGSVFSNPLDY